MKISVIIPAYNATSTILQCLQALEGQTLPPAEVIIIDDGSRDHLKSLIDSVRPKLKLKKLIFLSQHHRGVSQARNLGAKSAGGEILAFTDSDCIPPKNWLKKIGAAFADRKIGAAGGGYSSGIDGSFWQIFCNEELSFRRRKRVKMVTTLLSNNMACRKNIFFATGGFPKRYPVCEDMLLSYDISRRHLIKWLKGNGVKHHFKTNLRDYLIHQYFFGKQSTIFFLENPQVLASNNHQGKQLHLAIGASLAGLTGLLISVIFFASRNFYLGKLVLTGAGVFFFMHMLLYTAFLFHLRNKGLFGLNLVRAYVVSFLRDLTAAASFFAGLTLYIKGKSI